MTEANDAGVTGRGWAMSTSLIALPYHRHTTPASPPKSRHKLDEVLADVRGS
jgi:hypothetical protein